jgi:hypothetical protein
MNGRMITILVNEQSHSVIDGLSVGKLRDRVKPDADVLIGDLVTAAEPGRGLMAPRVGIAAHDQIDRMTAMRFKKCYD